MEIVINTINDLVADLEQPNSDLSGSYVLGADINAAGYILAPIGSSTRPFTGTFDGGGHTINNLTVVGSGIYVGLFADVGSGGTIANLGLGNLSVSGPLGYDVGGLAGRNSGMILNCYTTGTVTGIAGNFISGLTGIAIGGIAGWNFGTINGSYSAAVITSGSTRSVDLGGLSGGNNGTILHSYATGSVTGSSTGGFSQFVALGGLVGWDNPTGQIIDSHATGNVFGSGIDPGLGGLVGELRGGTIFQSYSTGAVNGGVSVTLSGGLVGVADNFAHISLSFATGSVITGSFGFAGGLVAELVNSTVLQSYAMGATSGGQAAGLIAWGYGSTITQSYAAGHVSGLSLYSGGLVGDSGSLPPTVTFSYWDPQSTGEFTSHGGSPWQFVPGVLPSGFSPSAWVGFDPAAWGDHPTSNPAYPYLTWHLINQPPVHLDLPFGPNISHNGVNGTTIVQSYGQGDHGNGNAIDQDLWYSIDFSLKLNTPIPAEAHGQVISVVNDIDDSNWATSSNNTGLYDYGFGNYVTVRYDLINGQHVFATYVHFEKDSTSTAHPYVGQIVNEGDHIGDVGLSGATFGAHLHVTYGFLPLSLDPTPGHGNIIIADGRNTDNPNGGPVYFNYVAASPDHYTFSTTNVAKLGQLAYQQTLSVPMCFDGYISGATVFVDANNNGQPDENEPFSVTDANGYFVLPDGGSGPLVPTIPGK